MAKEITPAFYWDLSDVPKFVKSELKRRVESFQSKPSYSESSDFTSNKYTHPASAWVRVCSNSVVSYGKETRAGFSMTGVKTGGFDQTYGFLKDLNGSVLGYTADGKIRHHIENERFKHRPSPGITSVETQLNGGDGKFRITTIKWKCWSVDQLIYMTPYWLTNSVSVSVEFGWNNFNPMSQLELNDTRKMLEHFYDGKEISTKVKLSNGNYDASMGVISDFSYDQKEDGSYDCITVVKNVGGFFSGVSSTGRSTNASKTGDSKKPEWKKYLEDKFSNDVLSTAKNLHRMGIESIDSQVFYSRENTIDRVRGNRRNVDFDGNKDNWWLSFGLFIKILNTKMSALDNKSDDSIFSININDTLIGAHPNLKSSNGNVLLIPNSICPDISMDTIPVPAGVVQSPVSANDVDLEDANKILENTKRALNSNSSSQVQVIRFDLNKIINWWAKKEQSNLSFPASQDIGRVRKYKTGYLKNLYINFNAIKDLKNTNSFRSMLETLLKQMSDASGGIWDFRIVPLNPDGEGNGIMTIMDVNYSNFVSENASDRIWNFEYNNKLCIINDVGFSVKSTNAVATQTLFGKGTEVRGEVIISGNNSIDQTVVLPIGLSVNDRLISGYKDTPIPPPTDTVDEKEKKDPLQDRLISVESMPKRFLYTYGEKTFSFVEHVGEVQTGLIYGGESNTLRLYALQPGITIKFKLSGISGIRNLHTFTINDLPPPYGPDCFFQVQNVEHVVSNNEWFTFITAGIRRRPPAIR